MDPFGLAAPQVALTCLCFPGSPWTLPAPEGTGTSAGQTFSTHPWGISSPANPQEGGKNSQILPQQLLACAEFAATWDFHTGNRPNEPMLEWLESLAALPQNLQGTGAALGLSDLIH